MADLKTYRARERGYADDAMIEEGQTFSTAAPKGKWMALLDKNGNEIPDPEPEPVKADHEDALTTALARATGAEKERDDARAQVEKLKTDLAKAEDELSKALGDGDALRAKIAAFDHDGDGQPGGSAKTTAKK
jgi:chromosome segregation ATPase